MEMGFIFKIDVVKTFIRYYSSQWKVGLAETV